MNFIAENWQTIAGVIVFVIIAVGIGFLYYKNKLTQESIEMLIDYLDTIDDGAGVVPLLAGYAKKAVAAVEQLVKAGVIPKENEPRKNRAMRIVEELAAADDVELDEIDKTAVDSLIEAEIDAMHKA